VVTLVFLKLVEFAALFCDDEYYKDFSLSRFFSFSFDDSPTSQIAYAVRTVRSID
jgi:hypothetical protein